MMTQLASLLCSLSAAALIAGCSTPEPAAPAASAAQTTAPAPTPAAATAGVLYVSPQGDDTAAGSADAPVRTVQAAIDRAKPGQTVRVSPGVYRERLLIAKGGTAAQPVKIIADAGAVIDGSNAYEPDWQPAEDIGPGVYVTTIPFDPRCVTVDGKFLTTLDQNRVVEGKAQGPAWIWTTIFKDGINSRGRKATWKGVNGIGLYFTDGGRFYVRLKDKQNPAEAKFVFAPTDPAVTFDGASHVEFAGFKILNTTLGVRIINGSNITIDGCTIGPAREGVGLGAESKDCTIRYCEIFQAPYSNYLPDENSWETWTAHKRGGFYDMRGVKIERTRGGHNIHDNFIHHHWDGISSMGWTHWFSTAQERLSWAEFNQNMDIHHNRIEDMNDDSLEPNSAEVNNRWHDNLILRSRCALRVKVIDVGPLYLYRNLFHDNNEDIRFFGALELNPAIVYVYHNTSTSKWAITSNKVKGIGTPNYHVYNNLFYTMTWWHNTGKSVDPNWTGDYNVFVRRGDADAWPKMKELAGSLGFDTHSKWVENDTPPVSSLEPLDLSIPAASPARSAGTNLNTLFGETLPGLESPAYQAQHPDAGAVPFGQPMPTIPRPRPEDE